MFMICNDMHTIYNIIYNIFTVRGGFYIPLIKHKSNKIILQFNEFLYATIFFGDHTF